MPHIFFLALFLSCWSLLAWAPCACATDVAPTLEFASKGDGVVAAMRYRIPEGYHAYAHEAAETGRPTNLAVTLEGKGAMPVLYPSGSLQRDQFDPDSTVSTYEGDVVVAVLLPEEARGRMYAAELTMLLCSDRHCLPVSQSLSGTVPELLPDFSGRDWREAVVSLLEKAGLPQASRGGVPVDVLVEEEGAAPPPRTSASAADAEPQEAAAGEEASLLPTDGAALPPPEDFDLKLTPRYADAALEIFGLGKALFLGLLAGLILNAMPCVLPVLTFKISGLLLMGGGTGANLRQFREHNLCFAAGILTLFTGLALLLGLADLMWGQLYQNQAILLVMLLLVFLMGLSMLGVFSLPSFDLKPGAAVHNPRLQAYLTGLVSTFLATPCSGPLLGGVLGWAFTQPLFVLVVVFWSVGLGMALPYLVFSIWPALARILPRPGPWMHVFEHLVGFLLLATALYLLSILPVEKHMQVLSVLLVVALCAWLWGRYCSLSAPPMRRRILGVAGCVLLGLAVVWVLRPVTPLPQWRDFSPEYFTANLGKKPLLLEFTADWCPNCKFLEATVLTGERLREWQARHGMELVRVDLTRPNAYAVRLLEMLGSKSIPLTALFPAGEMAEKPLVLRDLYTAEDLGRALHQTFPERLPAPGEPLF
ncbi:MAG: cytochrome C biosynthesis protein [Desulfovibrio sp.]|uniref:cytochrome c biogenesis protein CcdA n=1 Tax=Desulfovibrio sp. TaxID=885 RepID=UPI001A73F81A|nr:cytochrome c biogenesis protein CcdA [Desulfovibrio sp.]MBD5417213.1 cytochrome C biosynthesis protein [Desulfovibrio sp.]